MAIAAGQREFAVVVLPGSFNPVHSEHVHSLELARAHLQCRGIAVLGGFLQPSSEQYVASKVGPEWAMRLSDRIATCDLAGRANPAEDDGEQWIYAWRSGSTDGFSAAQHVGKFLTHALGQPIQSCMVCGADLVQRFGGWDEPEEIPMIVLPRDGYTLPASAPAEGWYLVEGKTKPMSSTRVREAIRRGEWDALLQEGCEATVVEFMRLRHEAGTLFLRRTPLRSVLMASGDSA